MRQKELLELFCL